MAEELVIKISADDKASGVLKGLQGALGGIGNIAGTALRVGLAAGTAGLGALAVGLGASIKSAAEAEQTQAQLAAGLKSTKGAAGITANAANDLANSLSRLTTFEDDAILGGENLLLTFTNIGKDVFPQATEIMLDMSQALGQDLKSSALQLGNALNDPIQGVSALQRVGVSFTDSQKEQIKTLVESGRTMDAQKLILKELQTEFGGAAQAAGGTFSGQLTILKNSLDNAAESVGSVFLPTLTEGVKWLNSTAIPKVTEFAGGIGGIVTALRNVADSGDWSAVAGAFNKIMPADWAEFAANVIAKMSDAFKSGDWTPVVNAFWHWLDLVRSDISEKFTDLSTKFYEWASGAEGQSQMNGVGAQMAQGMGDGIKAFFDNKDNMNNIGSSIGASLFRIKDGMLEMLVAIGAGFATEIANGIYKAITGKDIEEKMRSAMQTMFSAMALDVNDFFSNLFNPVGMAKLFTPPHRAGGGAVSAGQAYIVGENQPELFVPNQSGMVLPSLAGIGGGQIIVQLTYAPAFSMADEREFQDRIQPFIERGIINARSRQIGSAR